MTVALIGRGLIRHHMITYRSDMSRSGGMEIPLGVIADLRVGKSYGVGLRVRREITSEEAALVGPLMREAVRRPFEFLKRDFYRILNSSVGEDAFSGLPAQHSFALCYGGGDSVNVAIPPNLRDARHEPLDAWVKDQLHNHLNTHYWPMLHTAEPTDDPQDEVEMARAA